MTAEVTTERTCGNCIHWRRSPLAGAIKPTGFCFRFPPKVAIISVQNTPMGPQALTNGFRPPVPADEPPCGEHRAQAQVEGRMTPIDWNRWQEATEVEVVEVEDPIEPPAVDESV